ncbi:Asp-tRNA(Asn)/Glu-tRNA(Gln) amidotransferase subunit GatC [Eggerthellaceae bacterium zg-997]|nr:Asp-tRNA(Asn)/Glu-tRNA(Gln) amidotransferase subunit GatC [Eggerthellaceae bacterium zg-997]
MTQHVSEHDVRAIAEYARIRLADDEVPQMTDDLNAIIESLAPLLQYQLEGVEPTFHPIGGLANVMRPDVEEAGFTQQQALANAPTASEGCFVVPSILGEGGDR